MNDPLKINPIESPLDADVEVPGSKSITNRALICAALASGTSVLPGYLTADDVEALIGVLDSVGVTVTRTAGELTVRGCGGRPAPTEEVLDARQSGTTARFIVPLLLLGSGVYEVSAHPQMQARPMGQSFAAIRELGAEVQEIGASGHLPVRLRPGLGHGGELEIAGDTSSQFLSGLLLAGPCLEGGLTVELSTEMVSRPYIDLTISVMRAFGAVVERPDERTFRVRPTGYTATRYEIEPDASAASYPLAAAAICGGRVKVTGLGDGALQGDAAFADVLAQMGVEVRRDSSGTEVRAVRGALGGGTFDLSDMSDTAPTLACVAPFASDEVRIGGIGFIRHKEIDRVAAVADGLRRCGIVVDEDDDGWTIHPGIPRSATLPTHEDHRMAMSFSLLGLGAPGIAIAGPDCVAKTFPGYWDLLETLRPGTVAGDGGF